jgi:TolB-like protein
MIQSGDRVRVDVQLVEAATGRQSWSQTYERGVGEVLTVQGEITRAIAHEIGIR